MSEEFGPDFVSVTDDEGNEFELEHLGTLEYNGQEYMAFVPADMEQLFCIAARYGFQYTIFQIVWFLLISMYLLQI